MRRTLDSKWMVGVGLALMCQVAFAMSLEERQLMVSEMAMGAFALIAVVAAALVFFRGNPDKREIPLKKVMSTTQNVYSVEADAMVMECVRTMHERKIGAVLVTNNGKLAGIFSERDAVTRVLVDGRDPHETKVFEVMTPNPHCVSPGTTVGAAMDLATQKHFRHLPVLEDGNVVAVLSTRHLGHVLAGRVAASAGSESISDLSLARART
jgi:CBS domain-containing protein